jgi:hypothetical protein
MAILDLRGFIRKPILGILISEYQYSRVVPTVFCNLSVKTGNLKLAWINYFKEGFDIFRQLLQIKQTCFTGSRIPDPQPSLFTMYWDKLLYFVKIGSKKFSVPVQN